MEKDKKNNELKELLNYHLEKFKKRIKNFRKNKDQESLDDIRKELNKL